MFTFTEVLTSALCTVALPLSQMLSIRNYLPVLKFANKKWLNRSYIESSVIQKVHMSERQNPQFVNLIILVYEVFVNRV